MTTKSVFIIVRVTPEQKKLALKKATKLKMTLSNYARNVINDDLNA
jgi:hypothetical protein